MGDARDAPPDGELAGEDLPAEAEGERDAPPECGDGWVDPGEECDDRKNGDPNDGCRDDCTFTCHNNLDCDDGHGCTVDTCDTDGTHRCVNSTAASGAVCRGAAGDCDVEERCTGSGVDCPSDGVKAPSVTCRDAIAPCDTVEVCDGTASGCPTDLFGPALTQVTAVDAGGFHTCALVSGGKVDCWGRNDSGQLGDGTLAGKTKPVAVVGLTAAVASFSTMLHHACAIVLPARGVRCWGDNTSGQLGNGTITSSRTATGVTGLTAGVLAVGAGFGHTCALLTGGGISCWGYNAQGQLGDGTTYQRLIPGPVSGITSGAAALSAGGNHTCAILGGAAGVSCWGYNDEGQLGDNSTTRRTSPVPVSWPGGGAAAAVAAGGGHTCAIASGGGALCWGDNGYGQLGDGTTARRLTPVAVAGLAEGVRALAAGFDHTCALLSGGGVSCWGFNGNGQLGDGTTTNSLTPRSVPGAAAGVAAVSSGSNHTCALLSTGEVTCWGDGGYGQLGAGTTTPSLTGVAVACK